MASRSTPLKPAPPHQGFGIGAKKDMGRKGDKGSKGRSTHGRALPKPGPGKQTPPAKIAGT